MSASAQDSPSTESSEWEGSTEHGVCCHGRAALRCPRSACPACDERSVLRASGSTNRPKLLRNGIHVLLIAKSIMYLTDIISQTLTCVWRSLLKTPIFSSVIQTAPSPWNLYGHSFHLFTEVLGASPFLKCWCPLGPCALSHCTYFL